MGFARYTVAVVLIASAVFQLAQKVSAQKYQLNDHAPSQHQLDILNHIFRSIDPRRQAVQCNSNSNGKDEVLWVYNAPARFVPVRQVEEALEAEYFRLFRPKGGNFSASDIFDNERYQQSAPAPLPEGVTQADLDAINEFCPREAFFYSMSPRHQNAITRLLNIFLAQPTAVRVLEVARDFLHNRNINPKVFYYALYLTMRERNDELYQIVPPPLQALPDQFVPLPIIDEAVRRNIAAGKAGAATYNSDYYAALDPHQDSTFRRRAGAQNASEAAAAAGAAGQGVGVANNQGNQGVFGPQSQAQFIRPIQPQPRPQQPQQQQQQRQQQYQPQRQRQQQFQPQPQTRFQPPAQQQRHYYYRKKRSVKNLENEPLKPEMTKRRSKRQARLPLDMQRLVDADHEGLEQCLFLNGEIGLQNGVENRLWYFREDLMVNEHHWVWHQFHPLMTMRHDERRGELFFYMHHEIIARYNAERLSNGLSRVQRLDIMPGAILEPGYNSSLTDRNSRGVWTPRQNNVLLQDIAHMEDPDFQLDITLQDYRVFFQRVEQAVRDGALLDNNNLPLPILNSRGIEHLGNTVEATELTANATYYHEFGYHILGHIIIALASDPNWALRVPTGVMSDLMVTMRDPTFYLHHGTVDRLFVEHKRTLPAYELDTGEFPLVWRGIRVTGLSANPRAQDGGVNRLRTFWSYERFPLEPGVDLSIHDGELEQDVCALHLNHEPFTLQINVNVDPCVHQNGVLGTMRIFLAPRYNEQGERLTFEEQRLLFFQLDSFPVTLQPGQNLVTRRDVDSALTRPWTNLPRDGHIGKGEAGGSAEFCGCGWPRHLLIPKGTPQGMEFDLFAMVTNRAEEQVQDTPEDLAQPEQCTSPHIMCGIPRRKYPDARPMGYPFDRRPFNVVELRTQQQRPVGNLDEYVSQLPNTGTQRIVIQHLDTIVNPES